MVILKPPAIPEGGTIGVFTPSFPANVRFRDKYEHGKSVLRSLGFHVVEGSLTANCTDEGYRSGRPESRAAEFMELIMDDNVDALVATIGGYNSASMIPFLDFEEIRRHPKVICGYSDVTSLHLSILAFSGLASFYGPAVVPSFGEWPTVIDETVESFKMSTMENNGYPLTLRRPVSWSNHWRDAVTNAWKDADRDYQSNFGWRTLRAGRAEGLAIVANLNTLCTATGTPYFPNLSEKILLLEEMDTSMSRIERNLRHLQLLGAFDNLVGLVFSKSESFNTEQAPFSLDQLVLEIVGQHANFPIILDFDCGHTHPMLTLAQMSHLQIDASEEIARFTITESMVV